MTAWLGWAALGAAIGGLVSLLARPAWGVDQRYSVLLAALGAGGAVLGVALIASEPGYRDGSLLAALAGAAVLILPAALRHTRNF